MPHWSDAIAPQYIEDVMNVYTQESGLEAFDVFPALPVGKNTGYIAKIKKEDWLKIGDVARYLREGAVESYGDDYRIERQLYNCFPYSFHKDLTQEDVEESETIFDAATTGSKFVVNRLKRVLLKNLGTAYLSAGKWGGSKTTFDTADKWTAATSNPSKIISDAKQAVFKTTGYTPNKAIITGDVMEALKQNTAMLNMIRVTNDKIVTEELIKAAFGLKQLTVLSAINETATDYMYKNLMLLVYTPDAPSKEEPSAGYHMLHRNSGYDGNKKTIATRKIIMEEKNDACRIEGTIKTSPIIMGSDLGYFLSGMI